MRRSDIKGTLNIAVIAATILLLGVTMAFGQTTTTTTLTASASTISVGQSDTFTANVTPVGTLNGTVTFYDNGTQIGTAVPDNTTGNAIFTTSALPVGPDSITATYAGDTNNNTVSTSAPYAVTVTLDSTSTTLTASLPTIFAGQSDTLVAAVVNNTGGAVPTGTVTFYSSGIQVGMPITLTGGSATLVTSALAVGTDSITAVYSGDSNNLTDTSNAVSVIVYRDPAANATPSGDITVITLTNGSPSPVTFTLTVPSNFTIGTGGTCPSTLTWSGGSCTVYLQATDQAGQSQSGTLSVTAADANGVSVNVIGGSSLALGTGVIPNNGETGLEQVITLSAGPSALALPDGSMVPMWGYTCGAPVVNSGATCRALNPNAAWSPVVITVPSGRDLEIELTNNLSFTPVGGTTPNTVPTSMMIVGQVGGGLGTPTNKPSPDHSGLSSNTVSWPTVGSSPSFVPPSQGPRVQSFATEVAAGATIDLIWKTPKPGTYLLESGTHPSIQGPMGLYGILVVTAAPTASAGNETAAGCAYPGATAGACAVPYDAEVPLLLSEIDPVQNTTVNNAVNTAGFSEYTVWSGQPGGCGNPSSTTYLTCYPPAVNYTPLYYTINGVAFNKTNPAGSLFPITPATIVPASGAGSVLVRLVNAGSRMHVPAIVGSQVAGATGGSNPIVTGFKVIAEDGNPLPGVPKIKSEVFMAAGKTYDVMINGQSTSGTTIAPYANALAVYDRELSLSGNAVARDAGMLAYIGVNPKALLPVASGIGGFGPPIANPDTYHALVAGQTLTVSDPSKGVIANDINVFGVALLASATNGTVTLYRNGTFTYVPNTGSTATSDSFTYCANGTVGAGGCSSGGTATVSLGVSNIVDSGINCSATTFNATMATYLAIKTPGVLMGCTDGAKLPLTVVPSSITQTSGVSGLTVLGDVNGGFTAIAPSTGIYTFTFQAKNSLGALSAATTVTVTFPVGSGLTVTVLDGQDKTTTIGDYRWIIEEDRTFYINPACSTNPPPAGCPTVSIPGQNVSGIVPTLGTNFHTSYMPYIAQGCTGPLSCEDNQTVLGVASVCDVGN